MVASRLPPPGTLLIYFISVVFSHQYLEPSVEPAREGIKDHFPDALKP